MSLSPITANTPDVLVENHGSIALLRPATPADRLKGTAVSLSRSR